MVPVAGVVAAGLLLTAVGCADTPEADVPKRPPPVPAAKATWAVSGFIGGAAEIDTGGLFTEPSDVAVYGGHEPGPADDKLFVVEADAGRSGRVQRLDRDGNFELAWGRDVVRRGAPDDTGTGPEVCRQAQWCKPAPPGSIAGAFRQPTAIAVDDESGRVFVMDTGNLRVQEFSGGGQFIRAWGWGVATGAARFEVCASGCRAGRRGPEGDANAGQFAPVESAGIAVRQGHGDVFATDGGNSRVMQFAADGRFLRAWGQGVATGGGQFEACTTASGCRAGRAGGERWVARGGWPRHVAVDRDGIVYASDEKTRSRLVRFDAAQAPDRGQPPAGVLMAPLESGHRSSGDTNMGIEVDSRTGGLVAMWDQGGPAVIDMISSPGGPGVNRSAARTPIVLGGYVRSVNGIGISPSTGAVYLPKSHYLNSVDPGSIFTGCRVPGGNTADCRGLMVISALGSPSPELAELTSVERVAGDEARLAGTVTPNGVASYRFELARRGERWRPVGPSRYVTSSGSRRVTTTASALEPGVAYRVRIALTYLIERPPNVEHFKSATRVLPPG